MLRVTVPAKLESLDEVNAFIADSLPEKFKSICQKLELAVEELLVNIFSYAYLNEDGTNKQAGTAEISLKEVWINDENCFCLTVKDWGTPFNPFSDAPVPNIELDAEARPIGGLGIFLIKTIAKYYSYSYTEQSNHIELYFTDEEN